MQSEMCKFIKESVTEGQNRTTDTMIYSHGKQGSGVVTPRLYTRKRAGEIKKDRL